MSTTKFKVGQVWEDRVGNHHCIELIRRGRIHSGLLSWDYTGRVGVAPHPRDLVEFVFTKGPAVDAQTMDPDIQELIDPAPKAALDEQVGGAHYKDCKIQPVEFITANNLTFLEGCVVKRICRHRNKNGREDLEKAIHEIRLMIELEYPEKP